GFARWASACWNSTSLLSNPRAMQVAVRMAGHIGPPLRCSVYAREMHSAHDLLTRWPVLDASAKRSRLQSFRLSAGPLEHSLTANGTAAERVAGGLWRRDPSAWSEDPDVQKKIANRLGWLDSPAL